MIKKSRKCDICRKRKKAEPSIKAQMNYADGTVEYEICDECALLLGVITEKLDDYHDGRKENEEDEDESL